MQPVFSATFLYPKLFGKVDNSIQSPSPERGAKYILVIQLDEERLKWSEDPLKNVQAPPRPPDKPASPSRINPFHQKTPLYRRKKARVQKLLPRRQRRPSLQRETPQEQVPQHLAPACPLPAFSPSLSRGNGIPVSVPGPHGHTTSSSCTLGAKKMRLAVRGFTALFSELPALPPPPSLPPSLFRQWPTSTSRFPSWPGSG